MAEECRVLALLEQHSGCDTSLSQSIFCLQALREPSSLISAIIPYPLDQAPQNISHLTRHEYVALLRDAVSGDGFRTMVHSVQ